MAKARQRGVGYSGPDSTRPTQQPESDLQNLGGTAPGGLVGFPGGAAQWNTPNAAAHEENSPPGATANPLHKHLADAMRYAHQTAADEGPGDGRHNVPIHPGLVPGLFRTAQDANPRAPDGRGIEDDMAVAPDSRPISPDGRHRGELPEIPKQNRGPYRS